MFLTPVRLLIAKWAATFPREAQRWPYELMLSLARFRVQKACPTASVWARNSFALDHWIFAMSDLDLSIWVNGGAREAQRAWDALKTGARWNLLGGETHVYCSEALSLFLPFGNPWELHRDPLLLERLGHRPPSPTPAQTLTYFVRQLLADQSLLNHPEARVGKWQRHFTALGLPFPQPFGVTALAQRLVDTEVFAPFPAEEIVTALETRDPPPALKRLLFPNQHVWCYLEAELDHQFVRQLPAAGHEYLAAMVEWEIWGLSPFTLVMAGFDATNLRGHWANQTSLIQLLTLTDDRRAGLTQGMSDLLHFYDSLGSAGASPR
jgi:hypothetical protein